MGSPENPWIAMPSGTKNPSQPASSAACAISHCIVGSPPGITIPYRMRINLTSTCLLVLTFFDVIRARRLLAIRLEMLLQSHTVRSCYDDAVPCQTADD